MDPKGKIALVTGGASGIGLAVAKELLQQGVQGVSICDVNVTKGESEVKQLQQEFGKNKAIFIKTDVSKDDNVEAAFNQTIKQFGGLDIVINNAGLLNDKHWQHCISVNLNGVIRTAVLALKYMGKDQGGKGGVIVNTGSIAAVGGGAEFTPIYNATKSAVVMFSMSLGTDFHLQRTGVRVMCVCPGFTDTGILAEASKKSAVFTLHDEWMTEFNKLLEVLPTPQGADVVGKAVLHMIREGENGSLWVSEPGEPPYKIKIPMYTELKTL